MRVLFIRPRSGVVVYHAPMPPLSSLTLASFLQAKGHAVRIFDHQLERNIKKAVREFRPDAAAVSLLAESMVPDALRLSRTLKAAGIPVFWGGHMASAIPEEAARSGCVDYVGISEGEYTMLELLEVVEGKRAPGTVQGIAYVDAQGEYHCTPERPFANLADFPPLDYSLIPIRKFYTRLPFANRLFIMMASKGCIFKCRFCFNSEYHRCQRREYPLDVIFAQMKDLAENCKVDGFLFIDELFGADKRALRAFCGRMAEFGGHLTWSMETVIGMLTREDMELMHAAGCRMLTFGLESGSAEMRRKVNKFYDASKIDETFRNCRELGILTKANFIIGLPDETPEQLRETVRLYFRARPHAAALGFFTAYPATPLYRELLAQGRLSARPIEEMGGPVAERQNLSQNFSRIPRKDLLVVANFIHWQTIAGKKYKPPGVRVNSIAKVGISNLLGFLRAYPGPKTLLQAAWEGAKFVCAAAWYAHAYPSIRKKYDLDAKNFGRTHWD